MSDGLSTVWAAEHHTIAKHKILTQYLNAWIPILSRQSRNVGAFRPIRYIDGFAGPGVYEKGEKGSPILALEAALGHEDLSAPVQFTFIDDKSRCSILESQLAHYREKVAQFRRVRVDPPVCGDCSAEINRLLDEAKRTGRPFGPALAFFDQFGYSSVPMGLIARVLDQPQCEVLTFLFWRDLNRFITDGRLPGAVRVLQDGLTARDADAVARASEALSYGYTSGFLAAAGLLTAAAVIVIAAVNAKRPGGATAGLEASSGRVQPEVNFPLASST